MAHGSNKAMWTTEQHFCSNRLSYERIRTSDQDYHFEMDCRADGLSTSLTDSDDRPWLFVIGGWRWAVNEAEHKMVKCGRKCTAGQMDESPSVEA